MQTHPSQEKSFKRSLFIFRRDLRLEDNTGLEFALENSNEVIPCFIFTPEQIEENPFRSDPCLQFMIESLEELNLELKSKGSQLYLFYGEPEKIVKKCIQSLHIDGVIVGKDYTPFSRKRDQQLETLCKKQGIEFLSFDDVLLNPPEETLKKDGKPYTIFTPYFRNASKLPVKRPQKNRFSNYSNQPIAFSENETLYKKILPTRSSKLLLKGGRKAALHILKNLKAFTHYEKGRDFPSQNSTTHLSAYLKFTVISPREAYYAILSELGAHHELIRALYWRDFFTHIAFFFPHVFEGSFHKKYDHLKWEKDNKAFQAWCEGKTGFPLVDAGMREMNETGFMHNRVRMVVASFLTKDLHLDWHLGEKYFANKLIDYDPSVNNGNWQWSASTGCDAQPYFRIFNPWNQQLKFDPDCEYIKRWIPELRACTSKEIHNLTKKPIPSYPSPILDHALESKVAVELYRQCR